MKNWLSKLNPEQRRAATHGDGPLLVIAGAGTGKTAALVARLAYLLLTGVPAARILLLTFTRRAAEEMISRARRLAGAQAGDIRGGTFHATANRDLRQYGRAIGLQPNFTIIDEADSADLMDFVRGELGVAEGDRRFPSKQTLASIYSHVTNAQQQLDDVLQRHFPWCVNYRDDIARIFDAYVARKRAQNVLDYNDLLFHWHKLVTTPHVGEVIAGQYDHILVDEYQDTNVLQAKILISVRRRCNNIMAVGDDAQAIYAFRAATPRNILDFPAQFPGTTIIKLEKNYRSTQPILAVPNAVMAQATEGFRKDLWSDRPSDQQPVLVTCTDAVNEAVEVCDNVLAHLEEGVPLQDQAVLFRTGHHSIVLEAELARRNIPFRKFGGRKFIEAPHIKDIIALVRCIENPHDEMAWFRVLQLLNGIGSKKARRIMNDLGVQVGSPTDVGDDTSGTSPLSRLNDDPPEVPKAARLQFEAFREAVADCLLLQGDEGDQQGNGTSTGTTVASQVERLRVFYEPIVEQTYENAPQRLHDIEQLQLIASRYRSRRGFISDLSLDPPDSAADAAKPTDQEDDYLSLSTVHSAKGREWRVVFVIHAVDGMIPSSKSLTEDGGIDEERRVLYVALTRAKDWLYVTFPLRHYRHQSGISDQHGYAQLTRFLPDSTRQLFEERVARDQAEIALDAAIECAGDVDSPDRRLW